MFVSVCMLLDAYAALMRDNNRYCIGDSIMLVCFVYLVMC